MGQFGGRYVPETLVFALEELTSAYQASPFAIPAFTAELEDLLSSFVGRPSPFLLRKKADRKNVAGPKSG